MPKRKRRLTKRQERDYAKVPITKEDEAKLRKFLTEGPPGVEKKKGGEEE
jgi:hypothetical protein